MSAVLPQRHLLLHGLLEELAAVGEHPLQQGALDPVVDHVEEAVLHARLLHAHCFLHCVIVGVAAL